MEAASRSGSAADVLIVGGGIVGLAIADGLASEGARVRLIEADRLASGASGAAAGMLAPVGEARLETEPGGAMLRLGLESLALFEPLCQRLRDETGIDPEFERSGRIEWAASRAEAADMEARVQRFDAFIPSFSPETLPVGIQSCDREGIESFGVMPSESFEKGLFCPVEAHVRPPLLARALAQSAEQRGVQIDVGVKADRLCWDGGRVTGIDSSEGVICAEHTIIATGVAVPALLGAELARENGIAIEPVRGQVLSLKPPLPGMQTICWAGGIYCVPKRDGSWVVGATEERVGFDRRVTAAGIQWLLARATSAIPALTEATFGEAWAGLRPVSADGRPFVGPIPGVEGLMIASGHGRNGVLLAPITARIVIDAWRGQPLLSAAAPMLPSAKRAV